MNDNNDRPRLRPQSAVPLDENDEDVRDGDAFRRYAAIIRTLRGPDGCPWDRKQTMQSLRRYIVEEAFELVAAINDGDSDHVLEEIGDLFLVILLTASAFEQQHGSDFASILDHNAEKLIRRHPHVFGNTTVADADDVVRQWDAIKRDTEGRETERVRSAGKGLPPLLRSLEIQKAAAKVGFDWPDAAPVFEKIREETGEIEAAIKDSGPDDGSIETEASIEKEVGDLFFSVVNLARKLGVAPEIALERTNSTFVERFSRVEEHLAANGHEWAEATLEQLDEYWEAAKREGF